MISETVTGRDINHAPVEMEIDKLTWRPGAYALVFNNDGKILVVDNTINKRKEFPGGGVDIHETFEEALTREVWEETGLNVRVESFITFIDEFFLTPSGNQWHTVKCFYRCSPIDGDLRPTILDDEPIVNPRWIDPSILTKDTLTIGWEALEQVMNTK
jgi:ADP-ribose pyrophosphatase YjhB (NUDIX family)